MHVINMTKTEQHRSKTDQRTQPTEHEMITGNNHAHIVNKIWNYHHKKRVSAQPEIH